MTYDKKASLKKTHKMIAEDDGGLVYIEATRVIIRGDGLREWSIFNSKFPLAVMRIDDEATTGVLWRHYAVYMSQRKSIEREAIEMCASIVKSVKAGKIWKAAHKILDEDGLKAAAEARKSAA